MRLAEALTFYFGATRHGLQHHSKEMERTLSSSIDNATPYEISLLSTSCCEKLHRWASDNRPLIDKANLDKFCKLRLFQRKLQKTIQPANLSQSWDGDSEFAVQTLLALRHDTSNISIFG